MKGDLSQYRFRASDNFTGTLFQQGRAFSDQDGNSADAIGRHLRQLLGRDAIGPGVAAVPHEEAESLKILEAESDGTQVTVTLNPGRVWVDGLHLYVPGSAPLALDGGIFRPAGRQPGADGGRNRRRRARRRRARMFGRRRSAPISRRPACSSPHWADPTRPSGSWCLTRSACFASPPARTAATSGRGSTKISMPWAT